MNRLQVLFFLLLPLLGFSQYELNNKGGALYVQKGSELTVEGNFINDTAGSSYGIARNDGTIEIRGDFQNSPHAIFKVNTDSSSKERVVKFIGHGTQIIKGDMNEPGSASFFNLVIDKASSTDKVQMQTDVTVEGAVVFGSSTTTGTYNPTNLYTNNNQKGLLETYASANEYVLNVMNGSSDAIAGYPALEIDGAPTTGYILTSGTRGSADGGLQRKVSEAIAYDYPVGTAEHGFNAVRMNFTKIPAGGGLVKGKFNDGTDNPSGSVGTIKAECDGCTSTNPAPDSGGYNRYFASDPCANNEPRWLSLGDAVLNHGYWSFASGDNNANYKYSIEAFPNTFNILGSANDDWRTLKYSETYGYNPSEAYNVWNTFIDSVANPEDLLSYTKNAGSCYTGNGIPGGVYSGLGHFSIKKGVVTADSVPVQAYGNGNLFIPNAFTPNGDGNNDYFQVYGNLQAVRFFDVQVFDRIGEKVYESSNTNFNWDGTYKSKPVPSQVLVYQISVAFPDDHVAKTYKGSLTLLR